jgi:PAS domain-containing protein
MEASNYQARSLPRAALAGPNSQPFIDLDEAHPLAQAIVDTIRDPLLVLDQNLRVVTANRAFHQTFRMNRQDIQGRPVTRLRLPTSRRQLRRRARSRASCIITRMTALGRQGPCRITL